MNGEWAPADFGGVTKTPGELMTMLETLAGFSLGAESIQRFLLLWRSYQSCRRRALTLW
jgi:hypothetical protein